MPRKLRILHAEDNHHDARLISRSIESQGFAAEWVRVESLQAFREQLTGSSFDLILSDFTMPAFDGLMALRIARELAPDTPFIYVSGTIGEERAVEALQSGAIDYVLKERLFKLGPAVEHALREGALRAQRQLAEAQLHKAHEELQSVLSVSPAVIYRKACAAGKTPEITFMSANVEALLGLPADSFREDPAFWFRQVHPEDQEAVRRACEGGWGPGPLTLEYRIRRLDGSYLWVADTMREIQPDGLERRSVVGSLVDVSERRAAEDRLRETEEEKDRLNDQFLQAQKMDAIGHLAGGVAHDFNNLLMVILNYADYISERLPAEGGLRHLVQEIRKAGSRAADLTHQLLAFSRQHPTEAVDIDVAERMAGLSKMIRRLIGERIKCVIRCASEVRAVHCDPSQFDQMLINLAVNSRDAMPEGGALAIEVDLSPAPTSADGGALPAGEYVRMTVTDTGVGIPTENLPRIFEPFFTTKPVGKGTGLGLSMVYGAVNQNHGLVTVTSEVGTGTRFQIFFPHVTRPHSALPVAQQEAPEAFTGLNVLLVEDDDGVREAIASMLTDFGFSVWPAAGGRQALERYGDRMASLDLLVTDVIMPDMGGRELARSVRDLKPGLPILFSSGYTEEIRTLEQDAGTHVIGKPFDRLTLRKKVRDALRRS